MNMLPFIVLPLAGKSLDSFTYFKNSLESGGKTSLQLCKH